MGNNNRKDKQQIYGIVWWFMVINNSSDRRQQEIKGFRREKGKEKRRLQVRCELGSFRAQREGWEVGCQGESWEVVSCPGARLGVLRGRGGGGGGQLNEVCKVRGWGRW